MKPKPDMAVLYVYPVHCILYSIFGPNTTLSKSGNHQSCIWTKYQNAALILICREEQILVTFPFLWL